MKTHWRVLDAFALLIVAGCGSPPEDHSDHPTPPRPDTVITPTPEHAGMCCDNAPNVPGWTGTPDDGADYGNADMAVLANGTTVEASETEWHLHTVVHNTDQGDDNPARDATVAIIMLPAYSEVREVRAVSAGGVALPWTQCMGYIEVKLSWLDRGAPGDMIDVWVKKSPSESAVCAPSFGVMVFGELPDMRPENNYWWWKDYCTGSRTEWPKWGPR